MNMDDLTCADCDWFALEPDGAWHGACLAHPIKDVRLSGRGRPFNAYQRVLTWQSACPGFTPIGRLHRPERTRMRKRKGARS